MSTIKVNKIENTSTTDGGVAIDVDGHVTIDGQQLPTAGPLSNRNLIINGGMRVAQRGTSSANLNAYASVDRFRLKRVLTDELAGTQSQSTEAPSGFSNSYKVDITTAETTLAADERFSILHFIEAQNLQHLEYNTSGAKAVTLSFWVRSHVPGTYAVGLQNIDAARNISLTYSISSADTWEHKTITFSGDTGGANPNNDNGPGFQIDWYLAAGSDFTSTDSSTWGATSDSRRAFGQSANAIGATGGFYITGVQLEVGSKATPFEHRSYGDELARCERYFLKLDLGQATANTTHLNFCRFSVSSGKGLCYVQFPVTMRDNPTYTTSASGTFMSASGYVGVPTMDNSTTHGAQLRGASTQPVNSINYCRSDAEGETAFFNFYAEL